MNGLRPHFVIAAAAALLAGCAAPHGQPRAGSEEPAPSEILDFARLYSENCAACHGENGEGGAAIALANPIYLAIADRETMRKVVDNGVKSTAMPAFAESAGGLLTAKQVDVIVQGIQSRWSRPGILDGANPPSYASKSAGDPERGLAAYKTYCESCHGADGRGGPKGSAITNDSFLALVSDQGLRTIVIVGRPELNAPDWRGNVPGKAMSDQDVTDVVAWLASKRVQAPGQPYTSSVRNRDLSSQSHDLSLQSHELSLQSHDVSLQSHDREGVVAQSRNESLPQERK